MAWPQACDFPPVVEASFVTVEGLPEREEPHHHATALGLARVELEDGEESEVQGVVSLFHSPTFDAPHWEMLGDCVRRRNYETARAYARGLAVAILAVPEEGKICRTRVTRQTPPPSGLCEPVMCFQRRTRR